MRLLRLLLPAFGPFTDEVLDFGSGAAAADNLTLVYGPNEAGKSSALRAMADLRFGIHLRSRDSFIHAASDLRVGGVFLDAQGRRIGLMRRKGRGETLSRIDPDSGAALASASVDAALRLALTAGLDREQFEAVFGLDHARLREGGARLLKGQGELGATLFEASAGTRGIGDLLAALDTEAKALYTQSGKHALINKARRDYDEQRKRWRESLIKPLDWQSLQRKHQTDRDALVEIDAGLLRMRRRQTELAELRTVAALLTELDAASARYDAVADAPDLPESAREQRLAAEQVQQRTRLDKANAEAESQRCNSALQAQQIESGVLEHAAVIERLVGDLEAYNRSNLDLRRQQVELDSLQQSLEALGRQFGTDADIATLLRSRPGDAERAIIEQHLDDLRSLRERSADAAERLQHLQRLDASEEVLTSTVADAALRQQLAMALQRARQLGDPRQTLASSTGELAELTVAVRRVQHDLGDDSIAAIRAARPLLDAELGNEIEAAAEADLRLREKRLEARHLDEEIKTAQQRREELSAAGEVVTTETLQQARAHRDLGWRRVRQLYIDQLPGAEAEAAKYDPSRPLAEAFAAAQEAADRQADLLRADARRAASIEQNQAVLARCERDRMAIGEQIEQLETVANERRRQWFERLAANALPALTPQALREWQGLRDTALDLEDRRARRQAEVDALTRQLDSTRAALAAALSAVGEDVDGLEPAELIEAAAQWEQAQTLAEADRQARERTRKQRQRDMAELQQQQADHQHKLQAPTQALRECCGRLGLPAEAPAEAIKARLGQLDLLARRSDEREAARRRYEQDQQLVASFQKRAAEIAGLLQEPPPAVAEDYAYRLQSRLQSAREQAQQRDQLQHDLRRAQSSLQQAETELSVQTAVIEQLRRQAGADDPACLPEIEERAANKRQARQEIERQRAQLASASNRPERELRAALADADPLALDAERESCAAELKRLEHAQAEAREAEERSRRALEAVDTADTAAVAREHMESAAASMRAAVLPWARLRLARALLRDALARYREQAQAPMVGLASEYFATISAGRYKRLVADEASEAPMLRATRVDGREIGVAEMSEGTADQLYLALRLAALSLRGESQPSMPLVLDDVLVTSDDARATNIFHALARFAARNQVLLFTHHRHLIDVARQALGADGLRVIELSR